MKIILMVLSFASVFALSISVINIIQGSVGIDMLFGLLSSGFIGIVVGNMMAFHKEERRVNRYIH